MKKMTIEFLTLDDGYATTQGTAYIDNGRFLCTKRGRGEFDVLAKISKFYTDHVIESILGPAGEHSGKALEDHIERLIAAQKDMD